MKRPKGRVGFVRISMWRSSGVEVQLFRLTEKQSGDDFFYLTLSLFPSSQAGSWMGIILSSTVDRHELKYLQHLEDKWRVLRIKVGWSFMCSSNALYTGLINPSLLLIFPPLVFCTSCGKLDQHACLMVKKPQNIALITLLKKEKKTWLH